MCPDNRNCDCITPNLNVFLRDEHNKTAICSLWRGSLQRVENTNLVAIICLYLFFKNDLKTLSLNRTVHNVTGAVDFFFFFLIITRTRSVKSKPRFVITMWNVHGGTRGCETACVERDMRMPSDKTFPPPLTTRK